jgi:hypothetical protein
LEGQRADKAAAAHKRSGLSGMRAKLGSWVTDEANLNFGENTHNILLPGTLGASGALSKAVRSVIFKGFLNWGLGLFPFWAGVTESRILGIVIFIIIPSINISRCLNQHQSDAEIVRIA